MDEEVQDAVSDRLKEDDIEEAANMNVNAPIKCQPPEFELTVKARYRPTLILVHGAWQTGQVMSSLAKHLAEGGSDANVPALPSPGAVPAVPNFATIVSATRAVVMAEIAKGKDVVLLMHSYGAIIG